MLRYSVRLAVLGSMAALALALPARIEAQGPGRVRVQAPPVRTGAGGTAARRPTAKEVPVRGGSSAARPDRYDRSDRDGRYGAADRYDRDRWDDGRWDRSRGDVGRWQVRSEADLRLFGFLGIDFHWDGRARDDRRRWLDRYHGYDGWGRFGARVDGWYAPRWGALRFERDPLRYGPRPLDDRDLRRVLGGRTFSRVVRGTPGGARQLWGRVERFGPGGRAMTLEVWSAGRFVAALTDFDRDGWVDDVVVNGRFWR